MQTANEKPLLTLILTGSILIMMATLVGTRAGSGARQSAISGLGAGRRMKRISVRSMKAILKSKHPADQMSKAQRREWAKEIRRRTKKGLGSVYKTASERIKEAGYPTVPTCGPWIKVPGGKYLSKAWSHRLKRCIDCGPESYKTDRDCLRVWM